MQEGGEVSVNMRMKRRRASKKKKIFHPPLKLRNVKSVTLVLGGKKIDPHLVRALQWVKETVET